MSPGFRVENLSLSHRTYNAVALGVGVAYVVWAVLLPILQLSSIRGS